MNTVYDVGDPIVLDAAFAEPDPAENGEFTPADPDTVTLKIWNDAGDLAYDLADDDLEHPDVGVFTYRFTLNSSGTWQYEWTATGPGAGSESGELQVIHKPHETENEFRPTLLEVGALIPARTKDVNGNEIGTFNDDTRPTGRHVNVLIGQAVAEVQARVDWPVTREYKTYQAITDPPDPDYQETVTVEYRGAARNAVALRAAMRIEVGYLPEAATTPDSAYARLAEQYERVIRELVTAVRAWEMPLV